MAADNNATKEQVEEFLQKFKARARFYGIKYIDDKPSNIDTLATLDITGKDRDGYVMSLNAGDYYQGPGKNDYPKQNDVWMFGKEIKGKEVYIKIFINSIPNFPNICISFHIAKNPMSYPLKRQTK